MEEGKLMAEEGFREYVARSRQIMDIAFTSTLQDLIGNSLTGDASLLLSALTEGKKIRGCLTCIVGEALGADIGCLVPRAVAIELIQAATLIHDDFVDQDRLRRNRPAVWTLEGARKAVLVGDVIFAGAIRMMSEMSREDGLAVARAIAMISAGALHEPLNAADLKTLLESGSLNGGRLYEKIIHLKTGILFGTACEVGAIAANAPPEVREAASRYGLITGAAYQIADDLKDIRGYVADRAARPGHMATLAPALLYFAAGAGPAVLQLLPRGEDDIVAFLQPFLAAVQGPMEREIERLLRSAASEIEVHFPVNAGSRLAKKAPWGTIRLFNEG